MSTYQPGVCNLGRRQRRKRRIAAVGAFLGATAYVAACVAGLVPQSLLGGVFVLLSLGFESSIQSYTGFCATLALRNRYAVDDDAGSVESPAARKHDRIQAAKITAIAVGCGAATTLVVVLGFEAFV
ncbi:MAG: hypothetical protein ABEJ79_00760 [Halolamina sp.]